MTVKQQPEPVEILEGRFRIKWADWLTRWQLFEQIELSGHFPNAKRAWNHVADCGTAAACERIALALDRCEEGE